MKIYHVNINAPRANRRADLIVRASRAAVALHRAADHFTDAELDGAHITVVAGEKIQYEWRYVAEVPCDPPGSYKYMPVGGPFATLNEANMAIDGFRDQHPDYRYVRAKLYEKAA